MKNKKGWLFMSLFEFCEFLFVGDTVFANVCGCSIVPQTVYCGVLS